jgi:hypothetical protein
MGVEAIDEMCTFPDASAATVLTLGGTMRRGVDTTRPDFSAILRRFAEAKPGGQSHALLGPPVSMPPVLPAATGGVAAETVLAWSLRTGSAAGGLAISLALLPFTLLGGDTPQAPKVDDVRLRDREGLGDPTAFTCHDLFIRSLNQCYENNVPESADFLRCKKAADQAYLDCREHHAE